MRSSKLMCCQCSRHAARAVSIGCIATLFVVGVLTTLSFSQGQERPAPPAQKPSIALAARRPPRDLSKMPIFDRQVFLSAQRGSEWLQRANGGDGRFVPGYIPALRLPLEGDNLIRQAAAALALANAAKYFDDEQAAAIARQAVLTLLENTNEDPSQPGVRVFTWPGVLDELEAAGICVQAISALPTPAADLLGKADQLCNAIHRRQQADGSFKGPAALTPSPSNPGREIADFDEAASAAQAKPSWP